MSSSEINKLYISTLIGILMAGNSLAIAAERNLPTGTSNPYVVEEIFAAKAGEIHISHPLRKLGPMRILLQANTGLVCELTHVDGGDDCKQRLFESKDPRKDAIGCEFGFLDQSKGCDFFVSASEMKPGSLFDATRRTLQRQHQRRKL